MLVGYIVQVLGVVGRPSCDQFVEDSAEGVHVASAVGGYFLRQLGRKIGPCAGGGFLGAGDEQAEADIFDAGLNCLLLGVGRIPATQNGQPNMARGELDVVKLLFVGGVEGFGRLRQQSEQAMVTDLLALAPQMLHIAQNIWPLHQFGDDKDVIGLDVVIVDLG